MATSHAKPKEPAVRRRWSTLGARASVPEQSAVARGLLRLERLRSGLWGRLAAMLLLIVSTVSPLTAMGHGFADDHLLYPVGVAASDAEPCGHSDLSAAETLDRLDLHSEDGVQLHLDCEQMCSVVGILADERVEDRPPGAPYLAGIRPRRPGQSPDGILRPPRLGMAAKAPGLGL